MGSSPPNLAGSRVRVSRTPVRFHYERTTKPPNRASASLRPPSRCGESHPPGKRLGRRPAVLVPALVGVALLVAGGVFAGQKLTQSPHQAANTAAPTAAAPSKTAAPNTGPLTGVYRVDFARIASMEGVPPPGAAPTTETWGISSACRASGCVATATRLTGETMQLPTMVLDQVGGSWLAVSVGSSTCKNVDGEIWETFTVEPRADGTLSGEATETMDGCANIRGVTFTRTGDVDISSLADPNPLPPRVVSPAEALHGRYRNTTFSRTVTGTRKASTPSLPNAFARATGA